MKNNELYSSYVIDVLYVCKKIIYKWKFILIIGLVMALALSGGKYALDLINYYSYVEDVEEGKIDIESKSYTEEEIQMMIDGLSAGGKANLNSAKVLNEQLAMIEAYMNESIYYNCDPYNVEAMFLHYYIDTAENSYTDADEKLLHIMDLYDGYCNYVIRSDVGNRVLEDLSWDIDSKYISELVSISISEVEQSIFVVKIVGNEEYKAEEIAESIDKSIMEYSEVLIEKLGNHKLTKIDSFKRMSMNESHVAFKNEIRQAEVKFSAELAELVSGFNDVQSEIYSYWTNSSSDNSTEVGETTVVKPDFSVKLLAIGFILGSVLMIFIETLRIIFSGKLDTTDTLEKTFGLHVLGDLSVIKEKKFIIDKLLDKVFNVDKGDVERRVEYAVTNLKVACEKTNQRKIVALSTISFNKEELVYVDKLVNGLKKDGIELIFEQSSNTNASALESMKDVELVVLVEKFDVTIRKMLEKEIALCEAQSEQILGVLIV